MLSLKNLGLASVFLWFMGGGIAHFTSTEFFVAIMPPWIGFHREIVYISGVLEILGALGILVPGLRQWAGNGLLLLVVMIGDRGDAPARPAAVAGAVLAALALTAAAVKLVDAWAAADRSGGSIGAGAWLLLAGAGLAAVGAALGFGRRI